jgi:hypothetical protein
MPAEKVRLRIGNLSKAVLVSGQAYQDPKDALNEFVSNAADEYVEASRAGSRITIVLRRKGRYPVIVINDDGRGMDPDRLRTVARSLFESSKAGDSRTLGEKAIGVLAFQQLGAKCDFISRAEGSSDTWVLRLARGKATAILEREHRRARDTPGTTVYLSDLDPDALRVLTQRKVVDYLRVRRGAALARGDYEIEVIEGRASELVLPEKPDGIRLSIPPRPTLWGRIEFALYVAPKNGRRRVAVVGRAGTTVVDDITDLEEFAGAPWNSDHVSGQIIFEGLQQTAGRRAIIRDRETFPVFVDAVRSIEAAVMRTVDSVAKEVDLQTTDRISDVIRRIFSRVLKELSDLENPMRTPTGVEPGAGGLLIEKAAPSGNGSHDDIFDPSPSLNDMLPAARDPVEPAAGGEPHANRAGSASRLPSVLPDPEPGESRSRFDPVLGLVYFNAQHSDYLMLKDSEGELLDYLSTLVAKEYVVYNNPRADGATLGEEMVRMLVRVRRHLPRTRRTTSS